MAAGSRSCSCAARVGQGPTGSIEAFLRTIDLTAVQLQEASPHVDLLLHALAAISPPGHGLASARCVPCTGNLGEIDSSIAPGESDSPPFRLSPGVPRSPLGRRRYPLTRSPIAPAARMTSGSGIFRT